MFKLENLSAKKIVEWLFYGAVVALVITVCYPDWSPFGRKNNQMVVIEKDDWMKAEKGEVTLNPCLDKEWMEQTVSNILVKAKLRESIQEEESNKLDLLYEIKAKLTKPILNTSLLKEKSGFKIDYIVDLALNLIDEDGFVIWKVYISNDETKHYAHNSHKNETLTFCWGEEDKEEIVIKALLNDKVPSKIAMRTKKIVYDAQILVRKSTHAIDNNTNFINLKEYVKNENRSYPQFLKRPELKG